MTDISPIVPDPTPTALLDDQDDPQIALWKVVSDVLSDREYSVLRLRLGLDDGRTLSFDAIGRQLGIGREDALTVYEHAMRKLERNPKTRDFAWSIHTRPAPVEMDVATSPAAKSANETSTTTVLSESAEVAADEPVSEKEALKLVLAADRELARAIERCAGREDLVAQLQRARLSIAAGMREIEQKPQPSPTKAVPSAIQMSTPVSTTAKRRGRPENVEETARRSAVLEHVQAGEITNAEAATELGLTYGAWAAWKTKYAKRPGVIVPAPTVRTAQTPEVAELVARIARVERFGRELRRRVRDLVAFVERTVPK